MFKIASFALRQSTDWLSASKVTQKDMGKIDPYKITTKDNKAWTVWMDCGV